MTARAAPPGLARLALFASGDFACNLYWQSVTFYLFFFYTDVLRLPPATAGFVVMAGALWDGAADLAIGIVAQRAGVGQRRFVLLGAAPLGAAFVLLYLLPVVGGGVVAALATHLLFRTCYAAVNVPYATWSATISRDSGTRARVAGLRMLFGTAAALVVAFATQRLAGGAGGGVTSASGYVRAALAFAGGGTAILLLVATTTPEPVGATANDRKAFSIGASLAALAVNRAFVTLNVAMACAGIAGTVLTRSLLYFFTYVVGDARAGSTTLALIGLTGAVFVPCWMAIAPRIGTRAVWLVSAAGGVVATMLFALAGTRGVLATQVFAVAMQATLIGCNFAFWAMLPDTVEYGEQASGVRVDAMAFGVAALVQKIALGIAGGLIGLGYRAIGYVADAPLTPLTRDGIGWIMLGGTGLGLAASFAAMLVNPLRRGAHAAIVDALDRHAALQTGSSSNPPDTPSACAEGATQSRNCPGSTVGRSA